MPTLSPGYSGHLGQGVKGQAGQQSEAPFQEFRSDSSHPAQHPLHTAVSAFSQCLLFVLCVRRTGI
jgi:hypothetical protein